MNAEGLRELVRASLEEIKARDIAVLDVREMTTITDYMVVCSGTSDRHVKAIADNLLEDAREQGIRPGGMEGEDDGEWVLVDLGDLIVHIMLPRIRDFYNLERLWDVARPQADAASE
ncbi:MAG: ribosome silencing factor [Pseudomonadota bacterium]